MPSERSPTSLPDITVAAVIETDGRFLVVEERIGGRHVFNQPAGHVEPGETLLAAVSREVREETAWSFAPQALLGIYLWRHPATGLEFMRFAFVGSASDHDPALPLDRAIVCTHWLTRAELAGRALRSPLVLRCIDDYLGGQRRSLEEVAELNLGTARTTSLQAVIV
jgi:8-oxo-dGTP pyrophosphatase MutT (NUDIX family)